MKSGYQSSSTDELMPCRLYLANDMNKKTTQTINVATLLRCLLFSKQIHKLEKIIARNQFRQLFARAIHLLYVEHTHRPSVPELSPQVRCGMSKHSITLQAVLRQKLARHII